MTAPGPDRAGLRGPLAFLAGGLVGISIFALGSAHRQPLEGEDLAGYAEVRQLVEDEFVLPRSREELLEAALTGLLADLDPYSRFYSGEDLERVERSTAGSYLGLGVVLQTNADGAVDGRVRFPLAGSPAEQAGLGVGDRLLALDGEPLTDLAEGELSYRLEHLGPEPRELLVERPDGQRVSLTMTPAQVVDPTVRHGRLLAGGVGYLAITSFSRQTLSEFDTAVAALDEQGLSALVLDLRGNLGGVLDAATGIANRFLASGALVITRTRQGDRVTQADPAEATLAALPLALLVDADSASASEVLAGALQDHRAAVLVGQATYGKGTVQTLVSTELPRGMAKLTTGIYSTPSGRSIDRHYRAQDGEASPSIMPDVEVPLQEEHRLELRHFLASLSPPPDLTMQVAALDDASGTSPWLRPEVDPQLDAALALLAGEEQR